MRLYSMIGYKLYKENEDGSIHMIRIVNMHRPYKITSTTKDPAEITILDYDTNERKKVRVDSLKEYTPLKPDGILTASIVTIVNNKGSINKDVIVSVAKALEIELGITKAPYAVCRQNITDVFNNLMVADESDMLVGLSISRDTCPANFDYKIMFAANSVEYSEFINFYRNDSFDDIFGLIVSNKFDEVLKDLYTRHINYVKKPELMFKNEHGGWCRNLRTLLESNNFEYDINQMLGITGVDFVVADYLEEIQVHNKDITYSIANEELRLWLSSLFKVNMKEAAFIEYDHDINLGDFRDNKYVLLRDADNKVYLATYTLAGEFYEADLKAKAEELDFSTKFRIKFFDKYNQK